MQLPQYIPAAPAVKKTALERVPSGAALLTENARCDNSDPLLYSALVLQLWFQAMAVAG
jgi:hypothetical protein